MSSTGYSFWKYTWIFFSLLSLLVNWKQSRQSPYWIHFPRLQGVGECCGGHDCFRGSGSSTLSGWSSLVRMLSSWQMTFGSSSAGFVFGAKLWTPFGTLLFSSGWCAVQLWSRNSLKRAMAGTCGLFGSRVSFEVFLPSFRSSLLSGACWATTA